MIPRLGSIYCVRNEAMHSTTPYKSNNDVISVGLNRSFAFSYVRFSIKRQSKGDSQLRQIERSRQYALENGLNLQESSYEDLGISAFDKFNATKGALKAFIDAVESGCITSGSYLLVENLDRLSRSDAIDAVSLLGRLISLGIRVVTLIDGKVLDEESIKDPMVLMFAVLIFIRAHEESATKFYRGAKFHARNREKRNSFCFGQGPGWLKPTLKKDGWEPIFEKVESIVKVFELTAKGYGTTAIAKIANKEKWPIPGKADSWHKTLPNKLVHNRRVLGEFEPQVKEGKKRRSTGERWENYYPTVVSMELFNAANAAVSRRRLMPKRRDDGYHNIFQGLLCCGHCGATFSRKSKGGGKNSVGYAIYMCADKDRGMTQCPSWNARILEDSLIPPLLTLVAADILQGSAKRAANDVLEIERMVLAQAKAALNNLIDSIEQIGSSDAIANRIRTLELSVEKRKDTIGELLAQANDPVSHFWTEDIEAAIIDALSAVRDLTADLTGEREALRQSFIRTIKRLFVWPQSHATVELHNCDEVIFLPLSEDVPCYKVPHNSTSINQKM